MLIKGGHEEGDALADALIEEDNMTSWQGQRIDTDEHARHRLHAGQCDRDFSSARARPWPTRSPGRASSSASHCSPRRGWGRARGRSGSSTSGSIRRGSLRLNQVTVTGTDYERSVDFYTRLGLKQIVDNPPDYARFETSGGVTLSVQIDPEEKIIATTAIYLECDDLDARVEQLARSGLPFEHGPRNQPWMWREARLRDPDGNIIFLYKAGEARRFPPWRMEDGDAEFSSKCVSA